EHERQIVRSFPVIGPTAERVAEIPLRPIHVACPAKQQTQIVQRLGKVRLQRQCLFIERASFLIAARQQERIAKVGERGGIRRSRRERRAKPADGGVEIAALRQQRAEIVVGLGQIWLQDKRPLERGAGGDRLAAFGQQRAETI